MDEKPQGETMTPEERARSILKPLTVVSDHPSSDFNPRSWSRNPQSITFDELYTLIVKQIKDAINETKEEDAWLALTSFNVAEADIAIRASKIKE